MLPPPPTAPTTPSGPPVRPRVTGTRYAPPAAVVEVPDEAGQTAWRWLLLGLGLAAIADWFLPRGFAWFLAAIPHELGHATMGSLLGRPSAPAISLRGEAWSGIGELRPWLYWLVAAALAGSAVALRRRPTAAVALGALALAVPLLAKSRLAEVGIAAAGHLGELAFATYCYAICRGGGRTGTTEERVAGALAGGLLQWGNLSLCWGLLTSAAARQHYAGSGSIGLKNDFLVLAEDLCRCRLQSVALPMLVLALLPLPLGWWLGKRQAAAAKSA